MRLALLLCLLLMFGTLYAQQGDNYIQKGNELYRASDYKTAEEQYKKALEKDPTNLIALFNLGNVQLRQKNMESASKQYDNLLSNTTDSGMQAKAYYNKALAFVRQQNLDEAIKAFKMALNLAPDDTDTRENLQKALNEKRQKQQQQNPQQQKKEQPKPQQQNQKQANRQLMEQKFNELRNQEKQLQKQLQKKPLEGQPEKDW